MPRGRGGPITRIIDWTSRHPLSELLVPLLRLMWDSPVEHFLTPRTVRDLFVRYPVCIDAYRPIGDAAPSVVLSPCDGRATVLRGATEKVKGKTRLEDCGLTEHSLVVRIALLPRHFHHVFSPVEGVVCDVHWCNGQLRFDPTRRVATNWRVRLGIVDVMGRALDLVLVGAVGVGVIHLDVGRGTKLTRGQRVGFFDIGGSCVVLGVLNVGPGTTVVEGECRARRSLIETPAPD